MIYPGLISSLWLHIWPNYCHVILLTPNWPEIPSLTGSHPSSFSDQSSICLFLELIYTHIYLYNHFLIESDILMQTENNLNEWEGEAGVMKEKWSVFCFHLTAGLQCAVCWWAGPDLHSVSRVQDLSGWTSHRSPHYLGGGDSDSEGVWWERSDMHLTSLQNIEPGRSEEYHGWDTECN